jgi:Cu(I)/Ag(I) efflux system periplasmic protein CusF
MNAPILALVLAIATSSGTALAATQEHDMSQHQMTMQPAAKQEGVGVLKAVNINAGKVQIEHEAIAALGWPPMTMWFPVQGALPGDIRVGDAVRFEMTQDDKKQWVIIKLLRK